MSKVCSLCGKRPVSGNNVSHSKRRTKRRFLPNLVSKRFSGVKILICTSCLRSLQKEPKVSKGNKVDEVAETQVVEESKKAEEKENTEDK